MSYLKWIGVIVLCLIVEVGCGTTIESTRANVPDMKVDKIYVILDMGGKSIEFNSAVKIAFEKQLKAASVDVGVELLTGLELDNDATLQKAEDNGSNYLLTLQMTAATIGQYNVQTGAQYDLNLYDMATKKKIWRARVEMVGTAYGASFADDFVKKVIDKLVSDKML